MHGWGSRGPLYPLYAPCTGGWGYLPKILSALEDHLCAKFHPDPSAVWISIEITQKHTLPFIVLEDSMNQVQISIDKQR